MKLLLSAILLLLTTQSFATGSLYCESKGGEFIIEGTLARVTGAPLVGETYLKINEEVENVAKNRIVNYWSDAKELKILILDENIDKETLRLEVKKNIFGKLKGTAKTANKSFKISCPEL